MRYLMFLILGVFLTACSPTDSSQTDYLPSGEKWVNDAALHIDDEFAPMLPMGDGSVLIFRRTYNGDYETRRLWPTGTPWQLAETINGFRVPYSVSDGYSSSKRAKYASVNNKQGIWLIGATIELIRPDNSHLTGLLRFPSNAPQVLSLPDDSVLVVGGQLWNAKNVQIPPKYHNVERIRLNDDGLIVSENVAQLPDCVVPRCNAREFNSPEGFSMIHIGQGRVLLTGGYGNSNTYIYDSASDTWRESAPLNEGRKHFSLSLLPDGRVLAAGGNEQYHDLSHRGMSTELWDPKTEQWAMGPKLPVPMRSHTAVLVKNKTVLLAGGRFAGVLAWDIGAPHWRIAAKLAMARENAGVVPLCNRNLALVGGWHARDYDEAYGRRTEGYSVVKIPEGMISLDIPAGLSTNAAVAVRGPQLFVLGGMSANTFDGGVASEPTASVEVYDTTRHVTRNLPEFPVGVQAAKVLWLDDHRVLVMALESDYAISPLWFVVVDTLTGKQTLLPDTLSKELGSSRSIDNYDRLQLVGVHDNRAWLIDMASSIYWFDMRQNIFSKNPVRRPVGRHDFSGRVLDNGKVVLAGGRYSQMVLAHVENCQNCPEKYLEFGTYLPLSTYEFYEPVAQKWITSVPSMAFGGVSAVLADGRVAKLGTITERLKNPIKTNSPSDKVSTLLELSDIEGGHWQSLTLPPPLQTRVSQDSDRLVSVSGAEGLLDKVLFFGGHQGEGQFDWWWLDLNSVKPVWQHLGITQAAPVFMPKEKLDLKPLQFAGHTLTLIINKAGITAFER
ncbi:MAG: hypothetical protein PHR16_00925 [Methylovulum sp.]|nr:hypothetical protein [Methylovulum sp.]